MNKDKPRVRREFRSHQEKISRDSSPESLTKHLETTLKKEDRLGTIAILGDLKSRAIITEDGVAHLFNRHIVSVKRAVQRGELPPPCQLFGGKAWTVEVLIRHIEKRLEQAAEEKDRISQRLES